MTHILLVRHGQSEWNAEGRWQGHADPPLSELGRRQAEGAADLLGAEALDVVVSSDLLRARQTATILSERLGRTNGDVVVEGRLRERDVGEWTGLTRADIEAQWPGALETGERPPGFELDEQVIGRVLDAVHDVAAAHRGRRVLVVAHGGVIRALERHLGAEAALLPNLGGRRIVVHDLAEGWMELGERLLLVPREVPATAPQQL